MTPGNNLGFVSTALNSVGLILTQANNPSTLSIGQEQVGKESMDDLLEEIRGYRTDSRSKQCEVGGFGEV